MMAVHVGTTRWQYSKAHAVQAACWQYISHHAQVALHDCSTLVAVHDDSDCRVQCSRTCWHCMMAVHVWRYRLAATFQYSTAEHVGTAYE
jgi:hypothetical protein